MNSIVTKRFINCHDQLKKNKIVKSSRQFALSLDYLPQSLSEILKNRRDVTIELIRKAVDKYNINPHYLFTGEGALFTKHNNTEGLKVLTVAYGSDSKEQIIHVPAPAQDDYPQNTDNQDFIKELQSFSLPDYKYNVGTHRSFDVSGDSMNPTLFEGDRVICSYLDPIYWNEGLKENYVYVIVTQSDILIRRIESQDTENNTVHIKADNNSYSSMEVKLSNLKEIWYVRAKFSPFLPSPQSIKNLMQSEINSLQTTLEQQTKVIETLSQSINTVLGKMND